MITLLVVISVVASTWLLCILLSNPASKFYVLDDPTHRSLHDIPKPRTGGIAIFFTVFAAWLVIAFTRDVEKFVYYLLVGMCLLAIISYLDDRYSVLQIWRLIVHVIAAIILVIGGVGLSAKNISINEFFNSSLALNSLTILVVVWMINLYNFMDGMDGLAGGMGFIGFVCLGLLGLLAGNDLYMLVAFIVAASNLGFLAQNFPPAKIFMGDVGSITMGYLVAFFSLWGIHSNIFAWWAPVLIFSPFIVDATITLARRLLYGEKVWEAHKSHYYQMLVQNGWGHRKTAIFEYLLMIAVAATVILLQIKNNPKFTTYFLLSWLITYILIIMLVSRQSADSGNNH